MKPEKPINRWRNSRFLVWLIYLSAALLLFLALLILLGAVGTVMPFRFSALGEALALALMGLGSVWSAFSIWRMGRRAAAKEARFEPDGVYFRHGKEVTDKIAWAEILSVKHGGGHVTIHCSDGRFMQFNGYMFFFPARLGKAIAARAGKEFNPPEQAEATA